jgi:Uncharacterised nucleotidyltransferase
MARTGVNNARLLTRILTDPQLALGLSVDEWTALLTTVHAERLNGSLAWRLEGLSIPEAAGRVLAAAKVTAETGRTAALWEAEMARRALAPLGIPMILLKGTAFIAAGLDAGRGRLIGDLDILVPRDRLDEVEAALIAAGWEWVKPDAYDDAYYRTHMHELPPLIHAERDRMIDVHHTILPLTARVTPDAAAMIDDAVMLRDGVMILSPQDRLLHAVAHLFADGDLAGGLRNLWDIDRLIREDGEAADYWETLAERARRHGLAGHLARALRLTRHLYATPVDAGIAGKAHFTDIAYVARLIARNGWGQETAWIVRQAFYIRSHWVRMPPLMLARHLWVKWRRG